MCNSRGRFSAQSCRHSCYRPDIEWALSLGTTNVLDHHQEDLFDTLANNSVDVVIRRCGQGLSFAFRCSGAHVFVAECELLCPLQASNKGVQA